MKSSSAIHMGSAVALAILLTGCVTAPQPLYSWNSYQKQVYSYLKSDSPAQEEQILEMEKRELRTALRDVKERVEVLEKKLVILQELIPTGG